MKVLASLVGCAMAGNWPGQSVDLGKTCGTQVKYNATQPYAVNATCTLTVSRPVAWCQVGPTMFWNNVDDASGEKVGWTNNPDGSMSITFFGVDGISQNNAGEPADMEVLIWWQQGTFSVNDTMNWNECGDESDVTVQCTDNGEGPDTRLYQGWQNHPDEDTWSVGVLCQGDHQDEAIQLPSWAVNATCQGVHDDDVETTYASGCDCDASQVAYVEFVKGSTIG